MHMQMLKHFADKRILETRIRRQGSQTRWAQLVELLAPNR
jgi:hypothetical protein